MIKHVSSDLILGMMENSNKLRSCLDRVLAGKRRLITDLDSLATETGMDSNDVRCAAAILLHRGEIEDIQPGPGEKMTICMRQ